MARLSGTSTTGTVVPSPTGARRASRRPARALTAAAVVLVLGAGAGTAHALTTPSGGAPVAAPLSATRPVGPPPIRLQNETVVGVLLHPYTSCWYDDDGGVCYDGRPQQPLASIGETFAPVTLSFPRDGWTFTVWATDTAGHRAKITLATAGAHAWRLDLDPLKAGRYALDITGAGPEGDVAAAAALTLR